EEEEEEEEEEEVEVEEEVEEEEEDEEEEEEATAGVKVEIVSNSTAESIGLMDEDVIHSINGYKMIDWSDISTAVSAMKPGEKIVVEYEREGKKGKVEGVVQSQAERIKLAEKQKQEPVNYAFLGIHSNEIDEDKASKLGFETPFGSYISLVVKGTAAEKAGLKPFDYVYGIDDYRVSESKNLTDILRKYKADTKATVHFIRNGKKESVEVTFGKRSDTPQIEEETDKCKSPFLGVNEAESDDENVDGVAVAPIKKSTAEELGIQRGDVITKINGARIVDWTDLGVAVDACEVGKDITVQFLRNGKEMTATKPMKSYCDTKPYTEWGWNDGEIHIFSAEGDDEDEAKEEEATGVMGRPEALDLSKVKVAVEDLTQQESDDMRTKYNMNMAPSNELRVNDLGLFPNPDQGAFRLQFELPEQGTTSIRIYNAAGRSIYDYDLGSYSGPFSDEVDISQNGPGAYYLEITQGTKRLTKKVVLQKVVN
ncbi:MAG: PDZ domain-containing protein, partial [Saprospiraceae bacterium]|nr:PDZ domain-containing protein [Saprospiraceae bacterium]